MVVSVRIGEHSQASLSHTISEGVVMLMLSVLNMIMDR